MPIVDDLLPACTVRIDVRNTHAGTGFFVGRGLIVTCAHVVESNEDPSKAVDADHILAVLPSREVVDGRTEERQIPVDVHKFAPGDVDLAVLKVREPFESPVVLLDSSPTLARDELSTFAYPERKPLGLPRQPVADGVGGDGRVSFSSGQIQPGMSGGPLFNLRLGAVAGIISITRDARQDLGGYAIPIKWLFDLDPLIRRENARAHEGRSSWVGELTVEQRQRWQSNWALQLPADTLEFDVSLGETPEGWKVTARVGNNGPALEEWVDFNAVREEVARLFRDWASRGRVEETEQLRLLGGILFSAAFPRRIGTHLRHLMSEDQRSIAVNLVFEAGVNARVLELPWEHLCIPGPAEEEHYLASDERFSLTRVFLPDHEVSPVEALPGGATTALVAAPLPAASGEAPVCDVARRIERLSADIANLTVRRAVSADVDDLRDFLRENTPDVLHYVGFGRYQGHDQILLGPDAELSCGRVELLLEALPTPPPRLVILEMVGAAPPNWVPADFSVFAPELIKAGVDAVVGFQYPVEKTVANRFNRDLYTELLNGSSLEQATQVARRGVRPISQEGIRSFISPALFLSRRGPFVLCVPGAAPEPIKTLTRSVLQGVGNV
jgi:hypothetical protein